MTVPTANASSFLFPSAGRAWSMATASFLGVAMLTAGGCVLGADTTATFPRAVPPEAEARAAQHLSTAGLLVDSGKLDAALAEFGQALEDNPTLVDAHLGMGGIYHELQEPAQAARAYERAAAVDPNNAEARYREGLMRQILGELPRAISLYLEALKIEPDKSEANRDLATAYVQADRPEFALPYALRAVELAPEEQAASANLAAVQNLLGNHAEALRAYRSATELGPLDDRVLLGLANTHLKLGNYQRAANTLQSVVRSRPTPGAFERLGYAEFKRRNFAAALEHYRAALALDANEIGALNGLGAVLVTYYLQGGREEREQIEEAMEAWRRSIRLRPNQSAIVDLLARYRR